MGKGLCCPHFEVKLLGDDYATLAALIRLYFYKEIYSPGSQKTLLR